MLQVLSFIANTLNEIQGNTATLSEIGGTFVWLFVL